MKITKKEYLNLYMIMQKIRRFEEEAAIIFKKGKIHGAIHLYIGEESIAAGICAKLKKSDYITSTHRGHGHCIAKGADLKLMMAELFGKKTGYCKGKGGSMHIADFDSGIVGANGIVGGSFVIAVGCAIYSKLINKDNRITVCFFGDGATNEGSFHEALNFAKLKNLPILFVCENNYYAVSTPSSSSVATKHISDRAVAYNMEGIFMEGFDVVEVYKKANDIISDIRNGKGPVLLECATYRWEGHYLGDPQLYKKQGEIEYYKKEKDPIKLYKNFLINQNICDLKLLKSFDKKINSELKDAIEFAEKSLFPNEEDIFLDLYK